MITDLKKLEQTLHLNLDFSAIMDMFAEFPLKVPESFVQRMRQNDINDPLLQQILPNSNELKETPGFGQDPLGGSQHSPIAGLIHKYHGRVLLLVTSECAVNCRFCFRRHQRPKISDWGKVFSYIKNDITVSEVILSGGDPLMLQPDELTNIMAELGAILHIKRIRIHSRVPLVLPERITSELIRSSIPVILMVHCNHPQEINVKVQHAFDLLQQQSDAIFNQSVLLRGINDNSAVLIELCEKLFAAGVVPCYLHLLDKVQGAAHFALDFEHAVKIYREMKEKLPGYLVPKLVMETQNRKQYVYI